MRESTTGLNTVTGGLKIETCSMPPVLHSWPGLHGLPGSEGLFMSLQQSMPMSSIIAMPIAFIGHGSVGAWTPTIPLRGSAKLMMKMRQNRRYRFMGWSVVAENCSYNWTRGINSLPRSLTQAIKPHMN